MKYPTFTIHLVPSFIFSLGIIVINELKYEVLLSNDKEKIEKNDANHFIR